MNLFKSLFKGREDVFAVRWEKGNNFGYMPVYQYDPYLFRLHKMQGGSLKTYPDKSYLPYTNTQLKKHLNGEQLVGIYPLLHDNSSWFIVADFDKEKWFEECLIFSRKCSEQGIPSYVERSRSGRGGHVWVFFDKSYPATKSRKIFIHLLEKSHLFSAFDKSSSFDRLFPNQDFLSGKGLGNLIALPFHKSSMEQGNSCFVDEHLKPFEDQWKFLASIKRVPLSHLDSIYQSLPDSNSLPANTIFKNSGKLNVLLDKSVHLSRSGITPALLNFLKEELNFVNSEYFIKKKTERNTWGTERYFRFIEETLHEVIVPRGFIGALLRFCKQEKIDFEFQDCRKKLNPKAFTFNVNLRTHQNSAIKATFRKDFGVITAPPGAGKTVIGLKIIEEKQQPALIIVHRKQIMDQWIERIQSFLGIPKSEIGSIGHGKAKAGKSITVAMIQSLKKYLDKQDATEFSQSFGTIIIDECHHVPAETFRNTISKLSTYYLYGLTSTPFRKGNDGKLIFIHIGDIISEIKPQEIEGHKRAKIIIRNTTLDVPFNPKIDLFETLSKVLIHDTTRNKLILRDITEELNKGNKAIVISERKEHIDTLNQFLKASFETILLTGEDNEKDRKAKWKRLVDGEYQVLITTGQMFGEGSDLQNASVLFLVYPFSFKGKQIQYIGRVQRSEIAPVIYDYRDIKIEYLNRMFLKRNTYYRHLEKQFSLFEEQEVNENETKNIFMLEKKVKINIEDLDFRYGAIAFKYKVIEKGIDLEIEIENDEVRPEFDILKPYFARVLKSPNIEAVIFAEFENDSLVSQTATSPDLERINGEIIESIKFRYIEKSILGKKHAQDKTKNLLDVKEVQEGESGNTFYNSEEDLLNDLLKNKQFKHYRQLRYLASKHDGDTLKMRFVLNPFSFVFLLSGKEHYHIIVETLDTEEATYIWHLDKIYQILSQKLQDIDKDLNMIKNNGRQMFLESQPKDFSRVMHDYSDERKGFIVWKDLLEERLF